MTQEQREHIAVTIGMLEIVIAIMQDSARPAVQQALISQTEILQEVLDNDRRFPNGCPAVET